MTLFAKPAIDVFAPIEANGTPRGADMGEVQAWGVQVEYLANLAFTSSQVYPTRAELYANLVPAANSPAIVVGDPTPGNDGLYMKVGATTTGSWNQRTTYVPGLQFVVATDIGAGTPNAIIATTSLALSGAGNQLVRLNIFEKNTGSPVTVTFNGNVGPLTIKNSSGFDVAPEGLQPGGCLGYVAGSTFRLVSQQASDAIIAQAEAAAAAAAASAAEAAGYAALARNDYAVKRFAGDNVTKVFTLDAAPGSANNTFVTIDGIMQTKGSDGGSPPAYGVVGTTLTFATAPPGDGVTKNIEVAYGNAVSIGTPGSGTVGSTQLNSGDAAAIRTALGVGSAAADNRVLRSDGTTGVVQGTGVTIDDNNDMSGARDIAPTRGIKFPATQNPSTDPNTLDDYEEGVWVPAVTFGGASVGVTGSFVGTYEKIGRQITARGYFILTSKGSSTGAAQIDLSGLPQPPTSQGFSALISYYINFTGLTGSLTGANVATNAAISLTQHGATGHAVITDAAFTNTARLHFQIIYYV